MFAGLMERLRWLRTETAVIYHAARDPRTPWYARALVLVVVAYAVSPVDLIPDFIPVLGLLDDLVLIPLGIALAIRLIPAEALAAGRAQATATVGNRAGRIAALVVVGIWLVLAALVFRMAATIGMGGGSVGS